MYQVPALLRSRQDLMTPQEYNLLRGKLHALHREVHKQQRWERIDQRRISIRLGCRLNFC